MPQQYGLGRGLSSLIPPKKTASGTDPGAGPKSAQSPFVIQPAGSGAPTGNPGVPGNAPAKETKAPPAKPFAAKQAVVAPAATPKPETPAAPLKPAAVSDGVDLEKPRTGEAVMSVPVGKIVPNPEQPRVQFDPERLSELSQSIKEHGVLQPLIVTKSGENYELIAGERRLQASKLAGLSVVPVIVREADSRTKLELAIIENVQRHDLNPIEEARAYLRLTEEFGLHQEEVASKVGKSRSAVANTVRLLHLSAEIQRAIIEGKITEGHARALLMVENQEKQRALFELIVKSGLTVREAELQARAASTKPRPSREDTLDPNVVARMEQLRERLGTKVKIAPSGRGGRLVIEYYSSEELEALFQKFGI